MNRALGQAEIWKRSVAGMDNQWEMSVLPIVIENNIMLDVKWRDNFKVIVVS